MTSLFAEKRQLGGEEHGVEKSVPDASVLGPGRRVGAQGQPGQVQEV